MKEKIIAFLISISMLMSLSFADTVTTNVDKVPIQSEQGSTKVVNLINSSGEKVEKTGESGSFYKIKYNDLEGYISKAYTVEGAEEIKKQAEAATTNTGTSSAYYSSNNGYKNYKQAGQSWSSIKYSYGTIGSSGCGPTSVAICASGLGVDKNPGQIVGTKYRSLKASVSSNGTLLSSIGLKQTKISSSKVLSYLATGKPIIVHASAGYYTSGGHFMALTGVNGSKVYLSNPGSSSSSKNGWIELSTLISRNVDAFYAVSKK